MVEYNENVNLTSITEFEEVVDKHFVDSVLPFFMVEIPEGSSFIDVGTGAGFPALPLLIVRPDLKGTLCDSLNKRCVYLEKACELVGIHAEIIHARSEELPGMLRFLYREGGGCYAGAGGILRSVCEEGWQIHRAEICERGYYGGCFRCEKARWGNCTGD